MKIACFADAHISPYGRKVDPASGLNARFLDIVESTRFVVKDSQKRGCTELLFAGDMFRTNKPTPTELVMVGNALQGFNGPVFGIPGNHDLPRNPGEHHALAPITKMDTYEHPQVIPMCATQWAVDDPAQAEGYNLAVLPYPSRSQLAAAMPEYSSAAPEDIDRLIGAHLGMILQGLAAQCDPNKPSVLLAHISVDTALANDDNLMAGRDITISLDQIPESFTFVVLGHIHRPQELRRNVFYCGGLDRFDFGDREDEPRSYVILDTEAGAYERIEIPIRPYRTWHIDLSKSASPMPDVKNAICRVKIRRTDEQKPDYDKVQRTLEDAGCWDFRGFAEDVQRVSAARSADIESMSSLPDMLALYHTLKNLMADLGELICAADELEVLL